MSRQMSFQLIQHGIGKVVEGGLAAIGIQRVHLLKDHRLRWLKTLNDDGYEIKMTDSNHLNVMVRDAK